MAFKLDDLLGDLEAEGIPTAAAGVATEAPTAPRRAPGRRAPEPLPSGFKLDDLLSEIQAEGRPPTPTGPAVARDIPDRVPAPLPSRPPVTISGTTPAAQLGLTGQVPFEQIVKSAVPGPFVGAEPVDAPDAPPYKMLEQSVTSPVPKPLRQVGGVIRAAAAGAAGSIPGRILLAGSEQSPTMPQIDPNNPSERIISGLTGLVEDMPVYTLTGAVASMGANAVLGRVVARLVPEAQALAQKAGMGALSAEAAQKLAQEAINRSWVVRSMVQGSTGAASIGLTDAARELTAEMTAKTTDKREPDWGKIAKEGLSGAALGGLTFGATSLIDQPTLRLLAEGGYFTTLAPILKEGRLPTAQDLVEGGIPFAVIAAATKLSRARTPRVQMAEPGAAEAAGARNVTPQATDPRLIRGTLPEGAGPSGPQIRRAPGRAPVAPVAVPDGTLAPPDVVAPPPTAAPALEAPAFLARPVQAPAEAPPASLGTMPHEPGPVVRQAEANVGAGAPPAVVEAEINRLLGVPEEAAAGAPPSVEAPLPQVEAPLPQVVPPEAQVTPTPLSRPPTPETPAPTVAEAALGPQVQPPPRAPEFVPPRRGPGRRAVVPTTNVPRKTIAEAPIQTASYGTILDLADPDSLRAFVMAHGGLKADPKMAGEMARIPLDLKNNRTGVPWDVIAQQGGADPQQFLDALTNLESARMQKRQRVESERRALAAEHDEATAQAKIKALPRGEQVRILAEQTGRPQEAIRAEIETQQAQDATFEDALAFFDQAALERATLTREAAGAAGPGGALAAAGSELGRGAGGAEPGSRPPERPLTEGRVPERSAVGLPGGADLGRTGPVDLGRGRRLGRPAEQSLPLGDATAAGGLAAAAGSAPSAAVAGTRRAPARRGGVEQARIPGTAAAAVPATPTRATTPQADVTTAPLFGQERAAREAELAKAQTEIQPETPARELTKEEAREARRVALEKPFVNRPDAAMQYGDPAQSQAWQVLEPDYVAHRFIEKQQSYERALPAQRAKIEAMKPDSSKRTTEEAALRFWEKMAERYASHDPVLGQEIQRHYRDLVKKAVSQGKPVPKAVIAQHSEFVLAQTARERYEKGRHTSFANVSVAINDTMRAQQGFKVKRQDGRPITDAQIQEIAKGVDDVIEVVGPELRDAMRGTDLTIAHTNGKHPFLSDSGGEYHPSDRSISVGINDLLGRPVRALAHELGHWMDYEAGRALDVKTTFFTKSHKAIRGSHYVSEAGDIHGSLYDLARRSMTDTQEVARIMKITNTEKLSDTQKAEVERVKVILGHYWRTPRELWARLFEQYVGTRLGRDGLSAESPARYQRAPGWWSAEAFAKLAPMVESELEKRMEALKTRYPQTAEGTQAQAATPEPRKYSSTQVDLPDTIAEDMRAWTRAHVPAEILTGDGIEEKPHVTVKYGLHTNNPEKVAKLLADRDKPLTFTFGKMDVFEQPDHDVLLIKVKSPGLRALNRQISEVVRTTDTHDEYVPHATLAYVKKGEGARFVGDATFEGREVQAAVLAFTPKDAGPATEIPLVADIPEPVAADREGEAGFLRMSRREVVPGNPEIKEMNKQAENVPSLRTRLGKVKERLVTTQLNRFHPLKALGDAAKKAGQQFEDGSTPMEWAEITNARAAGRFDAWLTSAERVMTPIQKGGLEEVLNDYLTMKQMDKRIRDLHTEAPETYTAQGTNTETDTLVNPRGFDKAKITAELRELKGRLTPEQYTAVTGAADQWWALNREVLDANHDAGIISDAVHAKIVGRGDDYVPFQVLDYLADLDTASRSPGPRPLNVRYQDYLRKMAGTERDVANVIGASVEKAMKGFMLAERNLAVKQVTKLASVLPDVIQKVPGDTFSVPGDQEILSVFEDGARENYAVPKDIAATMLYLDEVQLDLFGKFLAYTASPLRAGATGLNVGFAVTNLPRDLKRMLYYSKYGAKSPADLLRAAYNWGEGVAAVYNKSDVYLEALRSGALYTTIQKSITGMEQLSRRTGRLSGDQGISAGRLKDLIIHGMGYINNLVEEATKMATFIRGQRQGASGQDLAYEVANYGGSPNFLRMGTWGKQLNVLQPFYNSRLQGTAGNVRRIRETKGKAAGKVALARLALILAPMTVLAYLWNAQFDDDHGMEELSGRDKQKFFILLLDDRFANMLGMGAALYQHADGTTRRKHLRIAKEEGEQVLVPILEAGLDVVRGKDRETLAKMSSDLLGNLSPVSINIKNQTPRGWLEGIASGGLAGLNPAMRIPAELGMNWSAYRQMPIVPRALAENVLPAEQVRPTTSPLMVHVAGLLGVSPIKLQYAVTSATGGLGQGVLQEVDKRVLGKSPPDTQSDYERLAQTPMLGRLLGTGGDDQDNTAEEELYTIADEAKRTKGSMKAVTKGGNGARVETLVEDRPLVLQMMAPRLQHLTKALAEVRTMAVWATNSLDADAETKKEILAVLADRRHSILEVFRALREGTDGFTMAGGGAGGAEAESDAETVPTGG